MTDHPSPRLQPVRPKARKWPWVIGIIVTFGLGVGIGAASVKPEEKVSVVTAAPQPPQAEQTPPSAPPAQVPPAVPAGPKTTMGEGKYEVGVDVAAGRYKTPGGDYCYWSRNKDDSGDFSKIITSDIVKGPASFTINKGEFVELKGDCLWTKV